jgi:antitoxin component of MazEF toxin-antitoxin module
MTTLKFVGRVSSQGNNLIVWIPKEFHKDAKQLKGKQVRIVIDDEIYT